MKVKLTYFKKSGKYYSGGRYNTKKTSMHEIFSEVSDMLDSGDCPGLIAGTNEFYAVVTVPKHKHNHPHLYHPRDGVFTNKYRKVK